MRFFGWAAALLFATFFATGIAHAKDDTDEPLDFYHALLHRVFPDAHRPDVLVAMMVIPSFSPEQVVALRQKGDRYEILALTPELHLWNYAILAMMQEGRLLSSDPGAREAQEKEIRELRAALPMDPADVGQKRCSRIIPKDAALAIAARYNEILAEPPRENEEGEIVLDGTSFQFFVWRDGVERRAYYYAPLDEWPEGRLANLSFAMLRYCARKEGVAKLLALAQPRRD